MIQKLTPSKATIPWESSNVTESPDLTEKKKKRKKVLSLAIPYDIPVYCDPKQISDMSIDLFITYFYN